MRVVKLVMLEAWYWDMYKNIHLGQHRVGHYLSDQPVTHYNTSL
jgi:hypothetical protein